MKRISDFFSSVDGPGPSKLQREAEIKSQSSEPSTSAGDSGANIADDPGANVADGSGANIADDSDAKKASVDLIANNHDIGFYVHSHRNMTTSERLQFLETLWSAPPGFVWPYSERKDGGKIRRKYLGPQHFTGEYESFTYSIKDGGVYCKACVLFAPEEVCGVTLKNLVKVPLRKYAHLTGKDGYLTTHLANKFHEDCVGRAEAFKEIERKGNIAKQMKCQAAIERDKNREILKHILQAIEFLGRLGLPLRGHQESEALKETIKKCKEDTESSINYNQGNFRALLQFMVTCNDEVLKDHLETASKNATYISSVSQNNLIDAIANVFSQLIADQVKEARYFSLLADETTDCSKQEQLVVCLRYVYQDVLYERFVGFAIAPDLSGQGLANQLLNILRDKDINIDNMVGQGYDGAAAMSGQKNGVQAHIRQVCPTATYVHCASHSLNLAITKAAEESHVRSAVALMNSIAVFYNDSNKRVLNLQGHIDQQCPETARTRLKNHCATRWVERHEAVLSFKELYPAVVASLEEIAQWPGDTGSTAVLFLRSLDGSFLVTMEILGTILQITKPLSQNLQSKSQNVHNAVESVKDCINVLNKYRADDTFTDIFKRASELYGEEIPIPRLVGRQKHRSNISASTSLEYYKRSVFYPFLDTCISQLNERFAAHAEKAYQLAALLPSCCESSTFTTIEGACSLYEKFLPDGKDAVKPELERWKAYWSRQPTNERTSDVQEALLVAKKLGTYPSLVELLHIFLTVPVTTATGERAFSALKYIKSYLRSTMSENRLNGLSHLYINKDIGLNYNHVIDEFSKQSGHRLKFI